MSVTSSEKVLDFDKIQKKFGKAVREFEEGRSSTNETKREYTVLT